MRVAPAAAWVSLIPSSRAIDWRPPVWASMSVICMCLLLAAVGKSVFVVQAGAQTKSYMPAFHIGGVGITTPALLAMIMAAQRTRRRREDKCPRALLAY